MFFAKLLLLLLGAEQTKLGHNNGQVLDIAFAVAVSLDVRLVVSLV